MANSDPHNIERQWQELLDSQRSLVIASVHTRNLGGNYTFFFRDKIIRKIAPRPVSIVKIEFDKEHCEAVAKKDSSRGARLTIHGAMLRELQRFLPRNSLCLLIDMDAYPLSELAIKLTFILASN